MTDVPSVRRRRFLLTAGNLLGWALTYNAVAIPLAATGLLNPLFAAVAMAGSSLVVVGNSARALDGNTRQWFRSNHSGPESAQSARKPHDGDAVREPHAPSG